ncbi:hypothetical protein LINPERHAP1_LOCUS15943, partial [Linum perenne]
TGGTKLVFSKNKINPNLGSFPSLLPNITAAHIPTFHSSSPVLPFLCSSSIVEPNNYGRHQRSFDFGPFRLNLSLSISIVGPSHGGFSFVGNANRCRPFFLSCPHIRSSLSHTADLAMVRMQADGRLPLAQRRN